MTIIADSLLDQLPADLEACLRTAEGLGKNGAAADADRYLQAVARRFPDSEWAAIHYAWSAVHLGDWDAALGRWRDMLRRFPDNWMAITGIGEALRELGHLAEADAVLHEAAAHYPDIYMPAVHHAWVAARRGDWQETLSRWQSIQARFPELEYARMGIAESLLELGRLDEAEAALEQALTQFPESAQGLGLRSVLAGRRASALTPVGRVRERVQNHELLANLPSYIANPEVLIEITSICNFACTYCVSPMKLRDKAQMSLDTFRHVIEQVAGMTKRPVRLHTDGEPTSHPQFRDMAKLANAHGLPICLATNGSLLDPVYLDIWMEMLISMSTTPEELAMRHKRLSFEAYIERIAHYTAAWATSDAPQTIGFQIIHYPQPNEAADREYRDGKNRFLADFCRQAGLYDSCTEDVPVDDPTAHVLTRKRSPSKLMFFKQGLAMGGLYPVDGKLQDRPRATAGFCDSPFRQLVIHSNGTLGACCVDLSGGTTFASAEEAGTKSLKELWESSPSIQQMRQGFLDGRVEREVCQRCLQQEQVAFLENYT